MTPNEVAQYLRRVASKIDASEQPSAKLVAADLRGLLRRIAEDQTAQQDQTAIPSSGVGKKMLGEALSAAQDALAKGDEAGLKKAIENVNKAHR